jgi:competence protein ComEC
MPDWKPGTQRGQAVNVKFNIPISFRLDGAKGNEGEEEPLEIYFLEMQHIYADSIFIKKGNVEVLIDAGWQYDGKYVDTVLTQYCADDRLDLFMVSHSDGDHIDGIANALKNVDNISLMVDYGGVGSGNVLQTRNKYTEKGMVYHSAYDCVNNLNGAQDRYYLTKDFYFDILNTGEYIKNTETNASNPHSLAVIFYYKNFSFFTAGDITESSEASLLKNEDLPEVTLYKASHHGSHGSNSQDLLDTLNPKAVAISAARANNYNDDPGLPSQNRTYNLNAAKGHPAAEAIERIYRAPNISQNLNVYWNAVNGTMKFTSYGKNDFTFTGSTPIKGYYDLTLTNGLGVWDESINDFKNRVTGEENFKFHETKAFAFRGYEKYLPTWARK